MLLVALAAAAQEFNLPKGPCGSQAPKQPQRRKSGEGLPPLPLPVTPLRRTERKRPPSPPPLIAKIQFGEIKEVEADGEKLRYYDWNKDPGDVPVLISLANSSLGVKYSWKQGPLEAFSTDPAQFPVYYYTGSDDFTLTDAEVERLREFVRAGGTIWGDTCFGDPDFFKAFVREMGKVLPDRHFRRLEPTHPIFNCVHRLDAASYTREVPDAPGGETVFYGVELGARTAIILSRYDLSCGWDGHVRPDAFAVEPNDARKLGVNMSAYALASYPVAIYQSVAKTYYEKDERARGDFVFGQARVGENWDCEGNAIANLLKSVATKTSTEVKFERRIVDLAADDLKAYPFVYLTGTGEFELTDREAQSLKRYVSSGGFLLASPSGGAREFDAAFRREIARALPGLELRPLSGDHAVYNMLYAIDAVSYADYVDRLEEAPPALPLEGISLGGSTPVIYSPYGLGGGWRGFDHPFGRDIAHEDAMKLGVNIVLYSMTH